VKLLNKECSGFKIAESTYKPNSVENQCLFCNNKALEDDEICQECKAGFEAESRFDE